MIDFQSFQCLNNFFLLVLHFVQLVAKFLPKNNHYTMLSVQSNKSLWVAFARQFPACKPLRRTLSAKHFRQCRSYMTRKMSAVLSGFYTSEKRYRKFVTVTSSSCAAPVYFILRRISFFPLLHSYESYTFTGKEWIAIPHVCCELVPFVSHSYKNRSKCVTMFVSFAFSVSKSTWF